METEPQIIDTFVRSGQVRLVYRHLAQIGDLSVLTGEASECGADQGKFWEVRDSLYREQGSLFSGNPRDGLIGMAGKLGLDEQTFAGCLDSGKHRQFVLDDHEAAMSEGVRSRPEFRLGDQRLVGALPFAEFQQRIQAQLGQS